MPTPFTKAKDLWIGSTLRKRDVSISININKTTKLPLIYLNWIYKTQSLPWITSSCFESTQMTFSDPVSSMPRLKPMNPQAQPQEKAWTPTPHSSPKNRSQPPQPSSSCQRNANTRASQNPSPFAQNISRRRIQMASTKGASDTEN